MFKVRFNDEEFTVEFFYNRGDTVCIMTPENDTGEIFVGYARKSKGDRYVKSVGQKLALTDAMGHDFSKSFRTIVWEKYLKTYKSLFIEESREKLDTELDKLPSLKDTNLVFKYTFGNPPTTNAYQGILPVVYGSTIP